MTITRIGKAHWEERGARIEKARKFAGLSQSELADAVSYLLSNDISRQIIYNLERGERDIKADELRAISTVLGQTEDWIDAKADSVFNAELDITWIGGLYRRWFDRPIDINAGFGSLKAA